jgi:hypothetical protein
MNEVPKFSERLWEWRSFSKTSNKELLNMIHELPMKFDRPTKMTDYYVWTPNCNLNIKMREQDLKIKELMGSQSCYTDITSWSTIFAEQWTTEVYSFPISTFLMKRIVQGLNIGNLSKTLHMAKDKEQFIELLQSQSNSVKVLPIRKEREQHLLPIDENLKDKGHKESEKLVTLEISHVLSPENVHTLSIEHSSIDMIRAAKYKLMRNMNRQVYSDMVSMNYLQAVKLWGLDKKIFE